MKKAWKHLPQTTSGGREVDVGGRGPDSNIWNNVLDFIIERSIARQDPRRSQDCKYFTWPVRNSLSGLLHTILVVGHLVSTWRRSHGKCSQAFPVFRRSSASVYYSERKPKNKNRGGLGTRLTTCGLIASQYNIMQKKKKKSFNIPIYLSIYLSIYQFIYFLRIYLCWTLAKPAQQDLHLHWATVMWP